jgi:hypothetical protein
MRGQRHAPDALYPRKNSDTNLQEAGWARGPVLTGAEEVASTGIRSPDRPVAIRYTAHRQVATAKFLKAYDIRVALK